MSKQEDLPVNDVVKKKASRIRKTRSSGVLRRERKCRRRRECLLCDCDRESSHKAMSPIAS